jgi:hypothetical protein
MDRTQQRSAMRCERSNKKLMNVHGFLFVYFISGVTPTTRRLLHERANNIAETWPPSTIFCTVPSLRPFVTPAESCIRSEGETASSPLSELLLSESDDCIAGATYSDFPISGLFKLLILPFPSWLNWFHPHCRRRKKNYRDKKSVRIATRAFKAWFNAPNRSLTK